MLSAVLHEFANIVTWPMSTGKHGGYNFWSGSLAPNPYSLGAVIVFVRHRNCHQKGCLRLGHNHPAHGWPACKHHWHEIPEHISALSELDG